MINTPVVGIINFLLKDNTGTRLKFAKYRGCSFKLNGIILPFSAIVDLDGMLIASSDTNYNCEITFDLMSYYQVLAGDKLAILNSIKITGDKAFAVEVLTLLSEMNLYALQSKHVLLNSMLSLWFKFNQQVFNKLLTNMEYFTHASSDYLNYEKKEVANQVILDKFYQDVDRLNEDYQRIMAKFNTLI